MVNVMKYKPDAFLLGMVLAVALAFAWPEPGSRGGALHAELLNKVGVALVFLLNGMSLSFNALKAGALRWPVHLVVQLCTFGLFPLLGMALLCVLDGWLPFELRAGLFYLCVLPSTVSSSVALTAAAKGNVPVALFNATLSTLIGVVLTPLWMVWLLGHAGVHVDAVPVVRELVVWVLCPLVLGQLVRPWLGAWAVRHKQGLHRVDRLVILFLIYTSFCDSVKSGIWDRKDAAMLVFIVLVSVALFGAVLGLINLVSRALGWPRGDRIAALLCGSKKTLASGIPMAQLIFGSMPGLGVILMPIMIYHPLQLALGSLLAGRWGRASAE